MGNLFDAFARANRNVAHLNVRAALVVFLCPLGVEGSGNARSRAHQNNRLLCPARRGTKANSKNECDPKAQIASERCMAPPGKWQGNASDSFHRRAPRALN